MVEPVRHRRTKGAETDMFEPKATASHLDSTLIPRSPRRRIRLVTVIGELAACPHPVGPTRLRQLDTSNGCQDHTVLPSASASLANALCFAHRPKPALRNLTRSTLPRPPHPIPTSVTIAIRPSFRDGMLRM